MAKFSLSFNKQGRNHYTDQFLRHLGRHYGVEFVPAEEADIVLLSVCDALDADIVWKARRMSKPTIMGGPEAANDHLYSQLVDFVHVGEGFEFFERLQYWNEMSTRDVLDEVREMPSIGYRGMDREVIPSERIDWGLCPIVQIGKGKKEILAGRGCHNKCKFCFTSWTTKHQENPNPPKLGQAAHLITNDHAGSGDLNQKTFGRSMMAEDYLRMTPAQAGNSRLYRLGIESFSEARRKWFGKSVTNEELGKIWRIAKKYKHRLRWFIIGGLDPQESVFEMLEACGGDLSWNPICEIKVTYFNAHLHTPLRAYDIRDIHTWDKSWLYATLCEWSHRYRLTMQGSPADGMFRNCWHRSRTLAQAQETWKWRNRTADQMWDGIKLRGWSHMYDEPNPTSIRFWWDKRKIPGGDLTSARRALKFKA